MTLKAVFSRSETGRRQGKGGEGCKGRRENKMNGNKQPDDRKIGRGREGKEESGILKNGL